MCDTYVSCDACVSTVKILTSMNVSRYTTYDCQRYTFRKECLPVCNNTRESMLTDTYSTQTYKFNNPCNYCFRLGYCEITSCDMTESQDEEQSNQNQSNINNNNDINNQSQPQLQLNQQYQQFNNGMSQNNVVRYPTNEPSVSPKEGDFNQILNNFENNSYNGRVGYKEVNKLSASDIVNSGLYIPNNIVTQMRFKEKSDREHINLIKKLENLSTKFKKNNNEINYNDSKQIVNLSMNTLDYIEKQEKILKEIDSMRVDYNKTDNNESKLKKKNKHKISKKLFEQINSDLPPKNNIQIENKKDSTFELNDEKEDDENDSLRADFGI